MPFIYDLTDTWTDAGVTYTSVKMDVTDTASDAASLLLDLLVAGSSKFSIDKNGNVTLVGTVDGVDLTALSSTVNGLHAVASSGSYNDLANKPSIPASIEDLNDVAAMTPGTGDVLTWSGTSWGSDTPDAVITTIGGLTDVTVTTPSTSHVLRYNGTNWENAQLGYGELSGTPTLATVATSGSYNDLLNQPFIPADLNDLSDVSIGTAALGEVIRYDGSNWVDAQLSYNDLSNKPSVPADINDLSDVTITTPATNEFLAYDGAGWINTTTLNTGTEDAVINGVDIGTGPGTGSNNTRVGEDALSSQTTGAGNVAVGRNALSVLTTGSSNTAVGLSAMYNATGTTNSTAIGRAALHDITTGGFNTALGDSAGFNTTTGQQNITIGYNARSTSATTSHEITLGNTADKSFRIPGSEFYINGGAEGTTGTRVGVNTATPAAQLHVNGAAQVDGNITADGLNLGDGEYIRLGASNDLQIYHSGVDNHGYITKQQGDGHLFIENAVDGRDVIIRSDNGLTTYFRADGSTGETLLYHSGNEKLATTSTGVDVTGDITVSGTVDGRNIAADGATLEATTGKAIAMAIVFGG